MKAYSFELIAVTIVLLASLLFSALGQTESAGAGVEMQDGVEPGMQMVSSR